MEITPNKNSVLIGPIWFLLIFGIISYLGMYFWADIQVDQCKMIRSCSGGEGLAQGAFVIFISLPSILISTMVSAISFFRRRKNNKYIGSAHRILLYVCIAIVLILLVSQFGIFYGLFNYIRDGVEFMLGI